MTQYEQVTEMVTEVIDGDTFETANRTVRLEDVDTPERGQLGFDVATNALRGLVLGESVDIYIVTYDRFDRAIAQVRVDGRSVNDIMRRYNK